jgi:putative glycosyltransferase (TIGR04372 family)
MTQIFSKFIRLINAMTVGLVFIIFNLKLLRKKYVVYMFSSRFGHFLQNTEIFLRKRIKKKKFIFVTENIIDNCDLLKLWSKYIDICPIAAGDFLRLFFQKKVMHLRPYIVPQDKNYQKNRIIKNIPLNPQQEIVNKYKKKNYITFSLRDSAYNKKFHNDFRDDFRDSNIAGLKKIIQYSNTKKERNIFVRVNKSFKKTNFFFYDYGYDKNYDLETALYLIKNSKYHIGSNTAIDTYAAFVDKKVLLFNSLFGANFASRLYTQPSLFVPINIYFKYKKTLVCLSKQVEFQKDCEMRFNSPHFTKQSLDFYGIFIRPNSNDEMVNIYKEFQKLVNKSFLLNKLEKKNQKLFWSIYPKNWKIIDQIHNISYNSPDFRGNLILSSYYVNKYKNFLT